MKFQKFLKEIKDWCLHPQVAGRDEKEIRACIQTTYEHYLTIWEKWTNFIEVDLSGGKSLKDAVPGELKQFIEDIVAREHVEIKNNNVKKQQGFQKFLQLPFKKIKLISKFEIKYQRKKKKVQWLIANCHININQFPSIYFSPLYEIYLQWESYI